MQIIAPELPELQQNTPQTQSVMDESEGIDLAYIKKKKEYRAFIKLVKTGKITSAVMVAKALRVNPKTIGEWMNTPKIRAILNSEINSYVSSIASTPDWKAKAYLLDKLTDNKEAPSTAIQINTIIDNKKAKYDL